MDHEKWALLGASRGLGNEFAQLVRLELPKVELFLASRSLNSFDFSKPANFESYCQLLAEEKPSRIIYFAAGGTYGEYQKFDWKDHQWTLNVTFTFPAFLLNYFLYLANEFVLLFYFKSIH
jgi:short-subunit dehydrogenase